MFKIYKYVDQSPEENVDEEPLEYQDEEGNDDQGEEEEFNDSLDDELDQEDESESAENENADFQGVIRTVPGACLVYKRKTENNTYKELWVYNAGGRDIKPEIKVRNSILAGTDIDPKTQRSPEGDQVCDTITVGNVQFLEITGLIN